MLLFFPTDKFRVTFILAATLFLLTVWVPNRYAESAQAQLITGPTLTLLTTERIDNTFWVTVRLSHGSPHTQYEVTTVHHTDIPYAQQSIALMTNGQGIASARMWTGCLVGETLSGTIFAVIGPHNAPVVSSTAL